MKTKKMANVVSAATETMKSYDKWVAEVRSDCRNVNSTLAYDIVCLGAEAGELLDQLKKIERDRVYDREAILLECGDVQHYLSRVLDDINASTQECMAANVEKLTNREKYGKGKHGKRS